jgi:hypothetical protein
MYSTPLEAVETFTIRPKTAESLFKASNQKKDSARTVRGTQLQAELGTQRTRVDISTKVFPRLNMVFDLSAALKSIPIRVLQTLGTKLQKILIECQNHQMSVADSFGFSPIVNDCFFETFGLEAYSKNSKNALNYLFQDFLNWKETQQSAFEYLGFFIEDGLIFLKSEEVDIGLEPIDSDSESFGSQMLLQEFDAPKAV